jgi:molecular chaperone GrpE
MGSPDPSTERPEGPAFSGPVIRDRRRLDPQTGLVRPPPGSPVAAGTPGGTTGDGSGSAPADPESAAPAPAGDGTGVGLGVGLGDGPDDGPGDGPDDGPGDGPDDGPGDGPDDGPDDSSAGPEAAATGVEEAITVDGILADLDAAQSSAAERLSDLQRLQAEFVNYRRRVDRDRDVARDQAVAGVLEALLPVLDDIHLARQHGDLEGGPFAAIAEKLDGVLKRFGLARYGEPGEAFDPAVHEALMRTEAELAEGTTTTTVVQVLQPGYLAGERLLRPARVAVADPQ